jgi:hypothetical protein
MDANDRHAATDAAFEFYRQAVYRVARQARIVKRLRSQHSDTAAAEQLLLVFKLIEQTAQEALARDKTTRNGRPPVSV